MKNRFMKTVQFLEGLQIMPKTMPGLQKIKKALEQTDWYSQINPEKVIVVAGTNGKGSTCAILEALLQDAGQEVGFYSSPHLVSTVERIRLNGENISEENFVKVFEECESLIRGCDLSHFEALTLMAGHYYFSPKWNQNLDYVIFEVGLGGTYDATNAFPHRFSVITALGFDHVNILGKTLPEIAKNKFGIVHQDNLVIYRKLDSELFSLRDEVFKKTHSRGLEVEPAQFTVHQENHRLIYNLKTKWGNTNLALQGARGAENAMAALTCFAALGFDPAQHLTALENVKWAGRMQLIDWPGAPCPVYLSGDHNPQGIQSLIEILENMRWKRLHVLIGIGIDKNADEILSALMGLHNMQLHLTVTPFKGRYLDQYPEAFASQALVKNENPVIALQQVCEKAEAGDLILITGSLYLVGEILKARTEN
jgi:dihydrofolate synthase/folylpolyglutamate synthase